MTTPFYAPPSAFRKQRVVLPEDEARHASKVLRHEAGDEIAVVDGVGGWHRVQLDHVHKRKAVGTVLETTREVGEGPCDVTVALGLLKNRNRFETFVEKAVELGVTRIVPLRTARTEKESLREERTRNLLIAALKQCGRTRLPDLRAPQALDAFLPACTAGRRFVCHEAVSAEAGLIDALQAGEEGNSVALLVGPEGGFSDAEVEAARGAGWTAVSLGPRRLRAETAALTAAAFVMGVLESRDV